MSEYANTARMGEIRGELTITLVGQLQRHSVNIDSDDLSLIIKNMTNKLYTDKTVKRSMV